MRGSKLLQARYGSLPVLVNKAYWNTAMPICLCIFLWLIHTTEAELNSCRVVATDTIWPKQFTIWFADP